MIQYRHRKRGHIYMTKEVLLKSVFNASTVQANYYYFSKIKKQYLEKIVSSDISKTKKRKLISACSKCNAFLVKRGQRKKNKLQVKEQRLLLEYFPHMEF